MVWGWDGSRMEVAWESYGGGVGMGWSGVAVVARETKLIKWCLKKWRWWRAGWRGRIAEHENDVLVGGLRGSAWGSRKLTGLRV